MRKEKMEALREEFPFLQEIERAVDFNALSGLVIISRLDRAFLVSIPVDESYSSSVGRSRSYDRLFAVSGLDVREVELIPSRDHSTGYAYDVPDRCEGQTYLSALVDVGVFDYLVHYHYSSCSWQDGNEDVIRILKKSKHSSLNEEWEKSLAEARREIYKEADV